MFYLQGKCKRKKFCFIDEKNCWNEKCWNRKQCKRMFCCICFFKKGSRYRIDFSYPWIGKKMALIIEKLPNFWISIVWIGINLVKDRIKNPSSYINLFPHVVFLSLFFFKHWKFKRYFHTYLFNCSNRLELDNICINVSHISLGKLHF